MAHSSGLYILAPYVHHFEAHGNLHLRTPDADFSITGCSPQIRNILCYQLDGSRSIGTICFQYGIEVGKLLHIVSQLVDAAAVYDITTITDTDNVDEFLKEFFELCDCWSRRIFEDPFWDTVLSGHASESVVLQWGVEFYHRVVGANSHNSLAANFCGDPTIRAWIEEHRDEEFHHAQGFLAGLCKCGLDMSEVVYAAPLPSTLGLVNYLRGLAVSDSIVYLSTYGIMHSPRYAYDRGRVNVQFDHLTAMYPSLAPLFEAFRWHTLLDIDLGHHEIVLERALHHQGQIERTKALAIVHGAHGMVTAFTNFFAGIYSQHKVVCENRGPLL